MTRPAAHAASGVVAPVAARANETSVYNRRVTATVDLTDIVRAVEDEARRIRDDALDLVLEATKEAAPVSQENETNPDPGALRDSLEIVATDESGTTFSGTIASDLDYAGFTDEIDTGPHWIEAAPGKLLRFWWENGPNGPGIYYFPRVFSQGTKGQHWFALPMQDRWDEALQRVA